MNDMLSFRTESGIAVSFRPGRGGLPLLFVHGMLGRRQHWSDAISSLELPRPCAALDLPWHAESDPPAEHDISSIGRAVNEALDALGWSRCLAVGHSMGCTALLLAGLERPERFQAQLLVGPHGDVTDDVRKTYQQLASVAENDLAALVPTALELWFTPEFRAAHPELEEQIRAEVLAHDGERMAGVMRAFTELPAVQPRLAGYPIPVTAVVMSDDVACPRSWAQPWLDAVNAKVVEEPGRHLPMWERPEAFARVLNRFVAALER